MNMKLVRGLRLYFAGYFFKILFEIQEGCGNSCSPTVHVSKDISEDNNRRLIPLPNRGGNYSSGTLDNLSEDIIGNNICFMIQNSLKYGYY